MGNKVKKYIVFFLLLTKLFVFSLNNIVFFDTLDKNGKYLEALDFLISELNKNNQVELRWRAALMTFEIAESLTKKSEKIKYYDLGINLTKDYLEDKTISKRDRAEMIHWYMINYASKMKTLGIFAGKEAIDVIPKIISTMDKCIEIDPDFAGSYFFKGKLYADVPSFLGGDKKRIDENLLKAIKLADDRELITMLVGAAEVFIKRNWSSETKTKLLKDILLQNNSDYLELSDKDFAIKVLNDVIDKYKKKVNPSFRDSENYKKAILMIEQLKNSK